MFGASHMQHLFACVVLLYSVTTNAGNVTIDFEDFSGEPFSGIIEINGFLISQTTSGGIAVDQQAFTDGKALFTGPFPNEGFSLEMISGEAFSLTSFDIGFAFLDPKPFLVEGYRSGSAVVSQNFNSIGGSFYETAFMSAGWDDLDSVLFTMTSLEQQGAVFDNIVVSTIPIPAAAWLFGSALAGLGWMRRQQNT